jgi:hypothetical protein
MTYDVSTFVDATIYSRVKDVQDSIHNCLREQLNNKSENIDWTTEKIETTLFKYSNRKCEDKLLITLSVEEKKVKKVYLYQTKDGKQRLENRRKAIDGGTSNKA